MIVPPLLQWLGARDTQRAQSGLQRTITPRNANDSGVLDLASNDYLGLARDRRVVAAAAHAATAWGAGSTGSRLVTGSTELHATLENTLAETVGSPSALVFSSGYLANIGAVTALADRETLIVSDALNHASLIDAIRLSGARVVVAGHRKVDDVRKALVSRSEPRALVVTDAVFSVDGDLAPLVELHTLARQFGATLLVDEAHSLGVIGDGGGGACRTAGISAEPDVVLTLTLSKALGSAGGAVAGHPALINHLINSARSFIFDTGLAPACVGAALESLRILADTPELAATVRSRARNLAQIATEAGWTATKPDAAVVSVLVGEPAAAVRATQMCAEDRIRVGCFRPPSVPDGISRLRLTARATLTDADLDRAAHTLARARSATTTTEAKPK
ncbi:MAG: 8-amino-7-oxononanoate synthase [Actinomycetes bacterium]